MTPGVLLNGRERSSRWKLTTMVVAGGGTLALLLTNPHLAAAPNVEVILRANWGEGRGELGLSRRPEGPWACPVDFDVSADGMVHVLDSVNQRCCTFDPAKGLWSAPLTIPEAHRPVSVAATRDYVSVLTVHEGTASVILRSRRTQQSTTRRTLDLSALALEVGQVLTGLGRHHLLANGTAVVAVRLPLGILVFPADGRTRPHACLGGTAGSVSLTRDGQFWLTWASGWPVVGDLLHAELRALDDRAESSLRLRLPVMAPIEGEWARRATVLGVDRGGNLIVLVTRTQPGPPEQTRSDAGLLLYAKSGDLLSEVWLSEHGYAVGKTDYWFDIETARIGADGGVYLALPIPAEYRLVRVTF